MSWQRSLRRADWHFREAKAGAGWLPARVPGCVHRDLRRAGRIPDPFWGRNELELQWIEERDWEYRGVFRVSDRELQEERVELVADGLDTVATVTLNGREIARTENMFVAHRWEVRPFLRAGDNEVRIRFDSALRYIRAHRRGHAPREFSDPVGGCQVIRKQPCQFGWDWGPRLVTAGIWRDLRLEGGPAVCLRTVGITQVHGRRGAVTLRLRPEMSRRAAVRLAWSLSRNGVAVATGAGDEVVVPRPELWWPQGQGAQPLYHLQVEARDARGRPAGAWARRIGLRTIRLERRPDRWGESFRFVVNGRAIFAKGANWIPAHAFVGGLQRRDYARDLQAAAAANMNMVRVWGGGVYEHDAFYDLCDELGLLVWQDFMFASSLYPGHAAFLRSVREEADSQITRLRHHACLALWCGNNELVQNNADVFGARPGVRAAYERLFHRLLPAAVREKDGVTDYWPSSPFRGGDDNGNPLGTRRGDTHSWDVWHARHPVKSYEQHAFRFVSEFGMQSYSSPATQATFCPAGDANVFGPTMENHQKNRAGNQIILDYVSRRYRFPSSQAGLITLSQLNQAYCMQVAVEHWRRHMPRSMGALYWQLNDCWPVASWSSIEFTGRWKALHFAARRFFAPALVSAQVPGDEQAGIGNYRRSTVRWVHLYTVYDGVGPRRGWLRWSLARFDGTRLRTGRQRVALQPGRSTRQCSLDFAPELARHGRDNLYLRVGLELEGTLVSGQSVFFAPPRFLALPRAPIAAHVRRAGPMEFEVTLRSAVFHHAVSLDLKAGTGRPGDNFFDLYPGEARTVRLGVSRATTAARLRKELRVASLVDTYA